MAVETHSGLRQFGNITEAAGRLIRLPRRFTSLGRVPDGVAPAVLDVDFELSRYQVYRGNLPDLLGELGEQPQGLRFSPKEEQGLFRQQMWIDGYTLRRGMGNVRYDGADQVAQDLREERRRAQKRAYDHSRRKGEDDVLAQHHLKTFKEKTLALYTHLNEPNREMLRAQVQEIRARTYAENLREIDRIADEYGWGYQAGSGIGREGLIGRAAARLGEAVASWLPEMSWERRWGAPRTFGTSTILAGVLFAGVLGIGVASTTGLDLSGDTLKKAMFRIGVCSSPDFRFSDHPNNWDRIASRAEGITNATNHLVEKECNLSRASKARIDALYVMEDEDFGKEVAAILAGK